METHSFDLITRHLAQFGTRRSLLKGIGGALALTAGKCRDSAFAASRSEGGLVYRYYQAIDAHEYKTAYGLLGAKFTSQQSLSDFRDGFADTVYDDLVINAVHPDPAHNRVIYDVTITAWHSDGTTHRFTGTYTEGREGGVPKLIDATIAAKTVTGLAPICAASDLDAVMLGDAGAGQRYGSVTVTNTAAGSCVLGGVPKVVLRDQSGRTLITGRKEQDLPITTVTLRPSDKANLDMRWSNWCGAELSGPPTVTISLYGGKGTIRGLSGIGVPPCLSDPVGPSSLRVKPWEAA